MSVFKSALPALFSLLALSFLTSCATTTSVNKVSPVRSLANAEQLQEVPSAPGVRLFTNESADLSGYNQVIIEPVTILEEAVLEAGMLPADEIALADFFRDALQSELNSAYTTTTTAGPGVLSVQVTITEADDSEVLLDTVTTALPAGFVISNVKRAASGTHSFVGEVTVEMDITDSLSGERILAATITRAGGKSWENKLDKWKDVKAAANYVSVWTADQLANLKAGASPSDE